MRIQAAHRHARPRQPEIATRLRGQFDGEHDFLQPQRIRHGAERQVRRGQRHPQPAPAVIRAEQHHRRALTRRELREKLRLPHKRHARRYDRLLVHRRGDERRQFPAETTPRRILQPRQRRPRGRSRAGHEIGGQNVGERIVDEDPLVTGSSGRGKRIRDAQPQPELLIHPPHQLRVAHQQIPEIITPQFLRHRLERDFRPDTRGITQRNADRVIHPNFHS